jgi:hypothetical protein
LRVANSNLFRGNFRWMTLDPKPLLEEGLGGECEGNGIEDELNQPLLTVIV